MSDAAQREKPSAHREGAPRGRAGLPLGRVAGIELVADWSLLIIFALVAINLALGVFPSWHPEWSTGLVWAVALGAAVAFFASVLLHELSHALVGRIYGIPVKRITLFIFGGMAHMEGEPPSPKSELFMAAVGPLTSVVIGVAAMLVGGMVAPSMEQATDDPMAYVQQLGPLATLLLWLGPVNILLGVFNMVPGFPLDGGRVLRAILWASTGDMKKATRWASWGGRLVSWIVMALGVTALLGGGLGQGLWLLLIGWFLNAAARMSYQQLVIRESLAGVSVSEVMRSDVRGVDPELPVERMVRDHLMSSDQDCFPVTSKQEELMGLVCLSDVRRVPQEQWETTAVGNIMTPVERLSTARPDEPASDALQSLGRSGFDQLPVLRDGQLLGLVRERDIVRWLSIHAEELPA